MFSFDHHLEEAAARQMGQPVLALPQRQMSDQLMPYKGDVPFYEPDECQVADPWVGEVQAQG